MNCNEQQLVMNSEYQRITSQLCKLQQQILYNEIPPLLLRYSQHPEPTKSPSEFLSSLLSIQKQQFITSIAKNIAQVKQESNRLKGESQGLRGLIREQEVEVVKVRECVQEMDKEKNGLCLELGELKARQQALGELINSSSLEFKIKEILKENQYVKGQLVQRDQLIQVKMLEIKEYIEKEVFWNEQVRALQNDNKLFFQDLSEANAKIQALTQKNAQLQQNQVQNHQQLTINQQHYRQQIQQLKNQCGRLKGEIQKLEHNIKQSNIRNKLLQEEKQKWKKVGQDVREQAKYLREQVQKVHIQMAVLAQRQTNYLFQLQQANIQVKYFNDTINQLIISHKKQIDNISVEYSQNFKQNQEKIMKLMKQLEEINFQYDSLGKQYGLFKEEAGKEKEEDIVRNQETIERVRKQYENAMETMRKQINKQVEQLKTREEQLKKQKNDLQTSLKIQKQHNEQYKLYNDQNNQLRSQLQRITSLRAHHTHPSHLPAHKKHYFNLLQLRQEIHRLHRENTQLRSLTLTLLQNTRKYVIKEINKIVHAVMEMRLECETCRHWEKYESSKREVGMGKGMGEETGKLKEVKSSQDLRLLNEKFRLIKEQNYRFGTRIQKIIQE